MRKTDPANRCGGTIWSRPPDEETAVRQANEKARREWEEPNWYEPGVKAPSAKEMGLECPVCTGAEAVTDEEYAAWKKELEEMDGLPFE